MAYEALQTEFNPFSTLIQGEPANSFPSFFGLPFDLNGGPAINVDGAAAMGMSAIDFPSSSSSDAQQWG